MTMVAPHVSVIIPHYHDESSLENLLKSISLQTYGETIDTIVVSNPKSHRAESICKHFKNTNHIQTADIGVNIARNIGLNAATGEILFFFDSDCLLDDVSLIQKHVEIHLCNPGFTFVGGTYETNKKTNLDLAYNYNQNKWLLHGLKNADEGSYLLGGHFSAKANLIKEIRFDETIAYGSSETEFFLRLARQGHKILLSQDLKITHMTHLSYITLVKKLYRQGHGMAYLEKKQRCKLAPNKFNFRTRQLVRSKYSNRFDLALTVMQAAYNLGYSSKQPDCPTVVAIRIFIESLVPFYSNRMSVFKVFLSILFKCLPRK